MRVALLAEDDPVGRIEIPALLWKAGFVSRIASDGEQLRWWVEGSDRHLVRIIVISAEFGGNTGGDWLAELSRRPTWQKVPTIATTCFGQSVFADALRRGGMPVLQKPVVPHAMGQALERLGLLGRRRGVG